MSQHRFPLLFATTIAGVIFAITTIMPVEAAAPISAAIRTHAPSANRAAGQQVTTHSGPPRITDYLDAQLREAPHVNLPPFTPATPLRVSTTTPAHREVFGYVNAANLGSSSVGYTTWDFNDLGTVAVFGLHVVTDGSFSSSDTGWSVWNSSTLTALMSVAHSHGVKVVPSIIFHDFSSTNGGNSWTPMCEVLIPAATSHTVADIASEVRAKGADGFNLDYEGNNQLCPNGQYQADMLVTLMSQLRSALPGYYISISTYNGSYYPGYFFNLSGLNPYVDSFFLMDYDSTWSNYPAEPMHCSVYCFSPNAPLIRYDYNDTGSVLGYLGLVPASKILLGVPYYGNTACIPGGSRPGPNAVPYTDGNAHWSVPRYVDSATTDGTPGVSYFQTSNDPYSPTDIYSTWYDSQWNCWRESYWDNTSSLGAKYDLVNAHNLRGVGIFTLDYGGGSPELWQLLNSKLGACISASVTPAPGSFAVGTTLSFTATSTGCSNPQYEYWILRPGSSWQVLQPFSSNPSFSWNTTGVVPGTFQIAVWVRQLGGGSSSYEAAAGGAYTLAGCTGATLTPGPSSIEGATTVSFTATATGCPTPDFEYWVLPPGGYWQVLRAYSSVPTFSWSTGGLPRGTYQLAVWARQHGSGTATYEAGAGGAYALTGCSSATLAPAPGSYPVTGTLSFTATAAGCSAPDYEFWMLAPGGSWRIVQAYSSTATLSWTTTGLAPGTYQVAVWVRQHGSSGASGYQAFAGGGYTLTGCSSATLSPAPGSFTHGTTISFVAGSSGCANPEYEYWVLAPGGSWQLLRGYGAAAFNWNTAGLPLGTYQIAVWVRQQGSGTPSYEAGAGGAYKLS